MRINKKIQTIFFIASLVFVYIVPCVCAANRASVRMPVANDQWNWAREGWTGDNRPYHRVRTEVNRAISQGQKFVKLMTKYKLLAQKSSKPLDKFRWAYVTYQAAIKGSSFSDKELLHVMKSLRNISSPKTYDYIRLRFLIESRAWPFRQLKKVGERLAERNPKDYEVKYYLVKILNPGRYLSERQEALRYSRDLIRIAPKRLSAHTALGFTYFKIWLVTKNKDDGDKSIAAYRKYLELAPSNHNFRKQAILTIKMIQNKR